MTYAYDLVRYPSFTFAATHPWSMGALAALFGRPFAPFESARVLEIGCGQGVNIINMALGAKQAEFVGVDLSARSIDAARETASACGCANAVFYCRDLAEIDAGFGRFDYVIAHGVYSWVPRRVREALMRILGERLSAEGVALVSYNVLPASRLRHALRDVLLCITRGIEDADAKVAAARSFLVEQAEAWSDSEADEAALKLEARRILENHPVVMYFDELSEAYAPQLLTDVVAAAAKFGLAYLCDAQPGLSQVVLFRRDSSAAGNGPSAEEWVRLEQLADFQTMRRFRYSLFCNGEGERRWRPTRLRGLKACASLKIVQADPGAEDGAAFESGRTKIRTNDAELARFLNHLAEVYPRCAALEAVSEVPSLGNHILRLFAREAIGLYTQEPPLVAVPGERPSVNVLARLQATRGEHLLPTLRHVTYEIGDPMVRALVPLIDGTRTQGELAAEVGRIMQVSPAEASARLEEILRAFARAGLMNA
jgi:SAM-dependent methyltransferase